VWATCRSSSAYRYNGAVPPTSHDFKIRDAEPADFETLWRIDQECFASGISYSRAELRTYMRCRGSFTLVAASLELTRHSRESGEKQSSRPAEGAIAGFIIAQAYRRIGHVITIDVLAAARRHGVGSVLLRCAEERLRSMGCESTELETAVDNLIALRFYKGHGYSVKRCRCA
jgi:ribosomal protein S18 acetylase RimI-like enzyme